MGGTKEKKSIIRYLDDWNKNQITLIEVPMLIITNI